MRIGIALVEAWKQQQADPSGTVLHDLRALVPIESEHAPLLAFIDGPDVAGLDEFDPHYLRGLGLELGVSPVIANDDPEEVKYNVFQALQYLADWLEGTAAWRCPRSSSSDRSRSLFASWMISPRPSGVAGRCGPRSRTVASAQLFEQILAEEVDFIRSGAETATKRTEVRWEGEAARWYPLAIDLLRTLMTDPDPPVRDRALDALHLPVRPRHHLRLG